MEGASPSMRSCRVPDVTICIPAWQAESFIDRTLTCAREQTHKDIHILVSVDASSDSTLDVCRSHARHDDRIEVIEQRERLGWSRNANALLDRVETEFFFLYFHDDIIESTYTERLLVRLRAHPEALSVHCDLQRFGNQHAVDHGNDYVGTPAERLLAFMAGPVKGTPLRSLIRSRLLGEGLRFAEIGTDGFWRCHPFLFVLLGSGPALRHPEILYRRWFRDGSLTTNWSPRTTDELIEGQRASTRACGTVIDRLVPETDQRALLHYCLSLFIMHWTRQYELLMGHSELIAPHAISTMFPWPAPPPALAELSSEMQAWIRQLEAGVRAAEMTHHERHGQA